jgi:hypothetical protein
MSINADIAINIPRNIPGLTIPRSAAGFTIPRGIPGFTIPPPHSCAPLQVFMNGLKYPS